MAKALSERAAAPAKREAGTAKGKGTHASRGRCRKPSGIRGRVFHRHAGKIQHDIAMKAINENANEGHQVTEAFHELIKLELSEWIPVIIIVLHRLAGIEHIMDDYSDTPLRRLETFIEEEKARVLDNREKRLITLLSELSAWCFLATDGTQLWNPLDESVHQFKERNGHIWFFESPDQKQKAAQVVDWLCKLRHRTNAQSQANASSS